MPVMTMVNLKELEAETVLLRASDAVTKYGLSSLLTRGTDGSVSCYGAIYVACGASHGHMPFDCCDATEAGVPEKYQPLAEEVSLYVEAFCDTDDLNMWVVNSNADTKSASRMFVRAAMRLIILGDAR